MSKEIEAVNGIKSSASRNIPKKPTVITVKSGDSIESLAQQYGMSKDEFKKWANITGPIKVGQKISLPTAKVEEGKGIYSIAKKYNMTMAEFCKLNGIKDPENYPCKKDEVFLVKRNAGTNSKPKTNSNKPTLRPSTGTRHGSVKISKAELEGKHSAFSGAAKVGSAIGKMATNISKWGSTYNPVELAEKIYDVADDRWGAVGRPDFDALIKEINPKNVEQIIKAFPHIKKNKDKMSLINLITDETHSSEKSRKDAVMHIYDTLARAKNAPASMRVEFKKELDAQFDKWIGYVDTNKLDAIINSIIGERGPATIARRSNPANTTFSPSKNMLWNPPPEYLNRKVNINGKTFTVKQLHDGAVAGAKNDPAFSKVAPNRRYTPRPYPYVNEEGKIEAVSELRPPTSKNGSLKGKVVIINSGHGGYCPDNGYFDAGTVLSVKNAEGNEMPVEEWRTADSYAEELTEKLQAKGATVVYVNGAVRNGGMGATSYLEKLLAGKKGDKNVQNLFKNTKKSDIAFMSIHVESVKEKPSSRACTVRAFPNDNGDTLLAQKINNYVGQNINILQPEINYNNYYVTRAMGSTIPAVLLELGNIANKDVKASLLSSNDRNKYTNALAQAIEETLLHK